VQSQNKPTETDDLGNTPLHTAVLQAHTESVNALLERSDKTEFIDIQNNEKLTALQMAVRDGRIEIVESLIQNDADYSGTFGSHNESLFDYAFLMAHPKLNLMFKAYGFEKMCQLADIQPNSRKALMLYTMGELHRIRKSGNDLATGGKVTMLEHGLTVDTRKVLIHALKIQRGWFAFRDADSYRLMPSVLKNTP
jgi:ankyrin repeat protein